MKFTLTGQRVVPQAQRDVYRRVLDEMERSADEPIQPRILGPAAQVQPGTDAVRAKPYDWIEFHFADSHDGPSAAALNFEPAGPNSTKVSVTLGMDVGLGMWLALKLFGKRMGLESTQNEMADSFIREVLKLDLPAEAEP
jgi:hypothetical protein